MLIERCKSIAHRAVRHTDNDGIPHTLCQIKAALRMLYRIIDILAIQIHINKGVMHFAFTTHAGPCHAFGFIRLPGMLAQSVCLQQKIVSTVILTQAAPDLGLIAEGYRLNTQVFILPGDLVSLLKVNPRPLEIAS